jgi:hypothetical protein
VLYNFDDKGAWKRLTMHSDYHGTRGGREFFCVEITLRDQRPEPRSLFDDFVAHTRQLGLFQGDLRLEGNMDLEFAYPICDMQAEERRLRLIELLAQSGIETIGRQAFLNISLIPPLQSRRRESVLGMVSLGCHIQGRRPAIERRRPMAMPPCFPVAPGGFEDRRKRFCSTGSPCCNFHANGQRFMARRLVLRVPPPRRLATLVPPRRPRRCADRAPSRGQPGPHYKAGAQGRYRPS